jgi:hypothetical protein
MVELFSNKTLFGWVITQPGVLSVFNPSVLFALRAGLSNELFLTTIASWAFIMETEFKLVVLVVLPDPLPVPTNANV